MVNKEITNKAATLTAKMVLPENVNGAYLDVYLLNNMNMANSLAESVHIGD